MASALSRSARRLGLRSHLWGSRPPLAADGHRRALIGLCQRCPTVFQSLSAWRHVETPLNSLARGTRGQSEVSRRTRINPNDRRTAHSIATTHTGEPAAKHVSTSRSSLAALSSTKRRTRAELNADSAQWLRARIKSDRSWYPLLARKFHLCAAEGQ